ncbi:MAG: hypothetical protein WCT19_00900 [Candidatus Paceibacterota bacterium]
MTVIIMKRGELKQKIILILLSGLTLGLSRSPKQYFKVLNLTGKAWEGIRQDSIRRTIKSLYKGGFVNERLNKDGTVSIVINDKGRKLAEFYSLDNLKINIPAIWDGNWRIVIFDIPEKFKKVREALRMHLRNLGFYELQKSVFVYPFPCLREIDLVVKFYNARKYIRLIAASSIDNELELQRKFNLKNK